MNLRPSGKQARLKDGWYLRDDNVKIIQPMIFPSDHPEFLDMPKGMKQVLTECNLWKDKINMQCKLKCMSGATSCCAK
jgi:hypothetical protein